MGETPRQSEGEQRSDRETGTSKIVGAEPQEEMDILEQEKDIFRNQLNKDVVIEDKKFKASELEREKTHEEKDVIYGILEKMPEFIKQYRGTPVELSDSHIHIIDREKLDEETQKKLEEKKIMGYHDHSQQAIFVFSSDNIVQTASTIAHEVIHFNSFISEDVKGDRKLVNRRYGLSVPIKKNIENLYFGEINEAVTEELARRFARKYFSQIPVLTREVNNVTIENYVSARNKLNGFMDSLYEDNKDKFSSREEVFNLFAVAVVKGDLLPLARLVEKTYGKGSFRRLGKIAKRK